MKFIRKLIHSINPPCPKCPYTLGHVKFFKSPCPMCKLNDYDMYYKLIKNGVRFPKDADEYKNGDDTGED